MQGVSDSNYMSDSALLAWVNEQQNRLYGELRAAMSVEEQRAKMASDVSDLKSAIQLAGESPKNLPALGVALDDFRAKYGDVPEFEEVNQVVNDVRNTAAFNIRKANGLTAIEAQATDPNAPFGTVAPSTASTPAPGSSPGVVQLTPNAAAFTAAQSLSTNTGALANQAATPASSPGFIDLNSPFALFKEQVDRLVKALGEKVDASNSNQQLGMIHIGEIKSTIDQGTSLASQLVKSGNDATSFIINNFA